VTYRELPLAPGGGVDWDALAAAVVPGRTRVAHVQRSCGYALRPTLSMEEIARIVEVVKAQVGGGGGPLGRGGQGVGLRRALGHQNRIVTLCHSRKAIDLALSGWATSGVFRMQDFTTLLLACIHIGGNQQQSFRLIPTSSGLVAARFGWARAR
jgi:hypothetical protein